MTTTTDKLGTICNHTWEDVGDGIQCVDCDLRIPEYWEYFIPPLPYEAKIKTLQTALLAAYAFIIAQDKCPSCYGYLQEIYFGLSNQHFIYSVCCECNSQWHSSGKEVTQEDFDKFKASVKKEGDNE